MGRYPFRECVNKVMAAYRDNRAESTLVIMQRRYNVMEREITSLASQGLMSTTNPRNFTSDDIEAFFTYLKTKPGRGGEPIQLKSIKKDLIDLDKLCKFEENNCVDVFRARCPALTKNDHRERLPVFSPSEIKRIFRRSGDIDESDPRLLRSYALLALYFGAGLRTIEAIHAEVDNIKFTDQGAYIRLTVVKGSGSYGHPRQALIIPQMVPVLQRYLCWRESYLSDCGRSSRYVFFSLYEFELLSDNTIRQIRQLAENDLGLDYDGRKCRRSYGQYLKNHGVDIECISSLMGHNNTETTEDYYARISPDMALLQTMEKLVD